MQWEESGMVLYPPPVMLCDLVEMSYNVMQVNLLASSLLGCEPGSIR